MEGKLTLIEVPMIEVPDWWERVRVFVDKMCSTGGGTYNIASVLEGLLNQKMQLWLALRGDKIEAAGISEITTFPLKKVGEFTVAGESMMEWKEFMPQIEAWARNRGCSSMRLIARKGWKKILKDYEETNIVLQKGLTI